MIKKTIAFICIIFLAQGCLFTPRVTIKSGNVRLEQVEFEYLDGWQNDNHAEALRSFIQSCNKFAAMPQSVSIGKQLGYVTTGDFRDVCEIANIVKGMSSKQAQNFFENWFKPFVVLNKNGNSKGIFTGYYEADLRGSKVKTEKFKYPIYAKPKDLGTEPYLTRKEINEGALDGKGLELLYVDDKVELYFLQVQGSGRITLPDGSIVKVTYAGKNNRDYSSIGAYMENNNILAKGTVSADSIKEWMSKNPDEADEVMNSNASFVFFKLSDGEYVVGAQNVPLTAERSLAVDSSIMPYGFPMWVDTSLKGKNGSKTKYSKLLIAQDTGSAIKGTVRGDIFFGYGDEAENKASYMASPGEYYILLPINVVDKLSGR
ncbi:MAG: MltA domain-containing protein [Rickettsiales bacterium]|nr:MltA domain-containing protein [Rickettsiales bacterium]